MSEKNVYIARLLTDTVHKGLDAIEGVAFDIGEVAPPPRDELLARVAGKDAAIVTLTERIDEEFFLAAGPELTVVANVAVGFDNIDPDAAKRHGVIITNTPGVLDGATADHTFALILAACRRIVEADRFLHEGNEWIWGPRMMVGLDLSAGATLGIIGFGRIGQAVAKRAAAFDMRVIASDATRSVGDVVAGVDIVSQEDLLAQSDVVSLHVPLLESTRHLMNAQTIAQMKKGSYLINCARGGVIDEEALMDAIDSGHLRGAGIDTFEGEPNVNPELFKREAIVCTPHTASAGEATRDNMCRLAVDNVIAVLGGRAPSPRFPDTTLLSYCGASGCDIRRRRGDQGGGSVHVFEEEVTLIEKLHALLDEGLDVAVCVMSAEVEAGARRHRCADPCTGTALIAAVGGRQLRSRSVRGADESRSSHDSITHHRCVERPSGGAMFTAGAIRPGRSRTMGCPHARPRRACTAIAGRSP